MNSIDQPHDDLFAEYDEEYPHVDSDDRKFKYDIYTLNPEMRKSIEENRNEKAIPSEEFWKMLER